MTRQNFPGIKRSRGLRVGITSLAIAASFGISTTTPPLQAQSDVGTLVVEDGWSPQSSGLTDAQFSKIYDERDNVRPGIYSMRNLKAQKCPIFNYDKSRPAGTSNKSFPLIYCPPNPNDAASEYYRSVAQYEAFFGYKYEAKLKTDHYLWQFVAIFPAGYSDSNQTGRIPLYTIRMGSNNAFSQLTLCVTIERGVVIGPRAITYEQCALRPSAISWTDVGLPDQKFSIRKVNEGLYEISPESNPGDCVALRNGDAEAKDLISWACNSNSDQRFNLIFYQAITAGTETELLEKYGWATASDGPQRNLPANGVNIPGGDYNSFDTIADNGKYCASACIGNGAQCKAYSWVAAGVEGTAPKCHLKSSITAPVNMGPSNTYKYVSSIIRHQPR